MKIGKPSRGEEARKKLMDGMNDEETVTMTRLSVDIRDDQKDALKLRSVKEKRSISEIIRELIDGYVKD